MPGGGGGGGGGAGGGGSAGASGGSSGGGVGGLSFGKGGKGDGKGGSGAGKNGEANSKGGNVLRSAENDAIKKQGEDDNLFDKKNIKDNIKDKVKDDIKKSGYYKKDEDEKEGDKNGKDEDDEKDGKKKEEKGVKEIAKKVGPLVMISAMSTLVMVLLVLAPVIMVASIDYNLQETLGFKDTTAILEEQAEHVTAEQAANGRVPEAYAEALALNGIEVGQMTASGDFVRTNTYIANIDELNEVASNDEYYKNGDTGELVFLFDGEIVNAGDFVLAVESNPKMYAAYSEAADISARYYYSNDVEEVYKDMGLSRNSFSDWENTGSVEEDKKNFNSTLGRILDNASRVTVNGCDKDSGDGGTCFTENIKGDDPEKIVNDVGEKTKDSSSAGATEKAAQLLNTAISASEPYKAAGAFMAVEEPLQRARIEGDGPVNYLMETLAKPTEVTYTDVNTGQEVTKKTAILDTQNFIAAASEGTYSKNEAANFSRDRVLNVTNTANSSVMNDTTVGTNGQEKSNIVLGSKDNGDSADKDTLSKATSSVAIAVTDDDSELFPSVVGANRVVEGGSFLSNSINSHVLGAMPSDAETISEYHHEVEKVLARQVEAERATLSPFDISSPNTFLGSLVYSFGTVLIRNSGSNFVSMANAVASVTSDSVASVFGVASAEGADDSAFSTIAGDCDTVKNAANVEGDLYCNSHNTVSTKYMNNTKEDWINENIGVDDSGKIKNDGDVAKFVVFGMGRDTTVGIKSADMCESYNQANSNIFKKIFSAILDVFGLYNACNLVPPSIADGSGYTLSESNVADSETGGKEKVEKYSGYVLYDTVSSLLEGKKSSVAIFKEEYYKEHPKDNSTAGIIARRSGLSKGEAQIALNYASYLDRIARYDASSRYAFGKPIFEMQKKNLLVEHSGAVQVSLYCIWGGKIEYADVRNRSFAV